MNSLSEIRQLILDEKWLDTQKMLNERFFGNPIRQALYRTVGNLFILSTVEREYRKLLSKAQI